MKLSKPCKKCFTIENRGKSNCTHCGFKLNPESFEVDLERAEAERINNLSEHEVQRLNNEKAFLEKAASRSHAKSSMNSTELIIVELLEEILIELRKSNKVSSLNPVTKAVLNASATSFVENFTTGD